MSDGLQPQRLTALVMLVALAAGAARAQPEAGDSAVLTEAACTGPALAATVPAARIGEPVSAIALDALTWVAATQDTPAHCLVSGRLLPIDTSGTAQPIRFAVALPATWNRRAIQLGGGGMNGTVPRVAGGDLRLGYATYGSDSGPRQRSEVGAQRRSDPQLGLRANEKDARRRARARRARLRRAPCLQLLRRRIAGWARRAHRRAALSRGLRRRVGYGADRGLLHADAGAHALARSGETAERLGAADKRPRAAGGVHAPMRRPRRAHRRRHQQLPRLPRLVQRQRRRP